MSDEKPKKYQQKKKPIPPVHARFKKGVSGNPGGKPKNPLLKALANLTEKEYRDAIEFASVSNLETLKNFTDPELNPGASALQVGVVRCFIKAIGSGNFDTIERIISRILGKTPDRLIVNSDNRTSITTGEIDYAKLADAMKHLENEF